MLPVTLVDAGLNAAQIHGAALASHSTDAQLQLW
jgi:hypothetical protein